MAAKGPLNRSTNSVLIRALKFFELSASAAITSGEMFVPYTPTGSSCSATSANSRIAWQSRSPLTSSASGVPCDLEDDVAVVVGAFWGAGLSVLASAAWDVAGTCCKG